jgi:hypothetical protein
VLADETPERLQDGRKGYIWTFVAERLIAYRFSPDRSVTVQPRAFANRLDFSRTAAAS